MCWEFHVRHQAWALSDWESWQHAMAGQERARPGRPEEGSQGLEGGGIQGLGEGHDCSLRCSSNRCMLCGGARVLQIALHLLLHDLAKAVAKQALGRLLTDDPAGLTASSSKAPLLAYKLPVPPSRRCVLGHLAR
jgi:hypothetical protein